MRQLGKVLAHIPARAGSKRVKAKNLRLLNGKPMLQYAIEAAQQAGIFDDIYVNSDSDQMLALAESLGVKGYKRSPELASDTATGDQFTLDFIEHMQPDTLVMISPVCPLVNGAIIKDAVAAYAASDADTLITCEQTQMQTFCDEKPVNIDLEQQLAPTQLNPVVKVLNWAVTIWDSKQYLQHFRETGSAYIGKHRVLYPIDPLRSIKVSHEGDFVLAQQLLRSLSQLPETDVAPQYWEPEVSRN